MEPLILTIGRDRGYLAYLNAAIAATGRRVVGAASEREVRDALANPEVGAAVLGGALPLAANATYRQIIDEVRPGLPLYQHDLRDGEQAFGELVAKAADALRTVQ